MNPEVRARRYLKDLQNNLHALTAMAERPFVVNIGRGSHLRFMLASFAIKQSEHAKSRLKLGSSPDTMLIPRTMIEGFIPDALGGETAETTPAPLAHFRFCA